MRVKEESVKAGLTLNIQKTKIMTSGSISSWQIDSQTVNSDRLLGLQNHGDCSHEVKRCLLFKKKAMTNLDSVLKSRDITLLTEVWILKAMAFPVVTSGCESWTIKKAFELMLLNCGVGKDLRVPWTAKRSNQSILKEITPEYSLEGLMLKLKLQYFGHVMRRALIWKDPDVGKDWRREEKGMTEDEMVGWHHWLNGHEFE